MLISLLMCSCSPEEPNSGANGNGPSNNTTPTPSIQLVYAEGTDTELIQELCQRLKNQLDLDAVAVTDASAASEHEIIIGSTSRALSKTANTRLSRMDKENEDFDNSYVICSDGKSLALAFDENKFDNHTVRDLAINTLVEDILAENLDMSFDEGTLKSETVNFVEYLEAELKPANEAKWNDVLHKLGGDELAAETVETLKRYYTVATPNMIDWVADLYDPKTGGFYYSNSARNTIGYAPDIESTQIAFSLLSDIGAMGIIKGPMNMPDWMKTALVNWLKPMQDPDGFFYHPQWGKELQQTSLARMGRDLWRAEILLDWCGAEPTYTTPNGVKGDYTLIDGTKVNENGTPVSAVRITERLAGSRAVAVSRVRAASITSTAGQVPSHLKDEESFRAYLAEQDIKHDSYVVGNNIASQAKQIANREAQLRAEGSSFSIKQVLEEWFAENQNPENGMWYYVEKGSADYSIYDGVNGLLKISDAYNVIGIEFPHPMEAIESAIEGIYTDENPYTVCYTYNTWFSVLNIFKNLETFSKNKAETEKTINEIRGRLLADAPNLIRHTENKVRLFKKTDGSFSYYQNRTSHGAQGMPVSVPLLNEGDLNATLICSVSTGSYMLQVLGIEKIMPRIFTGETWYKFLARIEDIGEVIKDPIDEDPIVTFDNYDNGDVPDEISFDYKYSDGKTRAIKDPRPNSRGKVLLFESPANGGDRMQIDCTNPLSPSCYILETEMCFDERTGHGYGSQLILGECYMLGFRRNGDRVEIFDTSSAAFPRIDTDFGLSVGIGEWFKLRVEYYNGKHETVRALVYVNDKLIAISDNYYNHSGNKITNGYSNPANTYTYIRLSASNGYNVYIMMDDVVLKKSNAIYEIPTDPDNQPDVTVDKRPTLDEQLYGFDSLEDGRNYPPRFDVEGEVTVISEGDNKYLSMLGEARLDIPHTIRTDKAVCDLFEADLTVKALQAGDRLEAVFRTSKYNERAIFGILLEANADGNALDIYELTDGARGDKIGDSSIALGETVKLGIEYYADKSAALIYINGKLCGFSVAVSEGAKDGSVGKIQLKTTAGLEVAVDNAKCERAEKSFSEAAKPSVDGIIHDFSNGLLEGAATSGNASFTSDKKLSLASGASISLPLHKRSVAVGTVILSAKLNIPSDVNGTAAGISLTDAVGNKIFLFTIKAEGGIAYICETTKNATYGAIGSFTLGEEHTLGLEYYRATSDVRVYVDGVFIGASTLLYSEASASLTPDKATVLSYNGLLLDDMVFEGYAKVAPDEEAAPDKTEGSVTFENSTASSLPEGLTVTAKKPYRITEALRFGAYSKILEFVTVKGAKDELTLDLMNKDKNRNATVFETYIRPRHDGNSTSYSFTAALIDSEGNVAYKFVIRLGDAGIQFHDMNGTSSGDMTVVAKRDSWFKLRVEYRYAESGKAEAVTYVNGVQVYRSTRFWNGIPRDDIARLTFTPDEGLNATVFLDDMYLGEEVIDPNKPDTPITPEEPKPEEPKPDGINPDTEGLPNDEDNAEVLTFESSSNGNFPNSLTASLKSANSSLVIEELIRAENNKKVMTLKTVKGNADSLSLALTKSLDGYNATVFETDIFVHHDGGSSSYSFTLTLADASGKAAYKFILRIGDAGMQMQDIGLYNGEMKVIAKRDTWFTLRVEYLHGDDSKVITYVDGVKVYESTNLSADAASDVSRLSFVADTGVNATVKLDNMSLAQRFIEITEEEPETPTEEESGPTLDFESGSTSSRITASLTDGSIAIEEYKEHKALCFTTVQGSADSITVKQTKSAEEGYNITVFEADMLLRHMGPSTAYNENLAILDKDGGVLYSFTLRHADAGVYMQTSGQSGAIIAQRWVWFSFRLEYHYGADGNRVLVYVNGELKYESALGASATEAAALRITPDTGISSKLYLDNVTFGSVVKEEN